MISQIKIISDNYDMLKRKTRTQFHTMKMVGGRRIYNIPRT